MTRKRGLTVGDVEPAGGALCKHCNGRSDPRTELIAGREPGRLTVNPLVSSPDCYLVGNFFPRMTQNRSLLRDMD